MCLLLIAKDDKNYYFVQSVGVESVLTNDVLKSIRDEYLEEDFEAGDINRGVNKCVTKLKNVLTAGIPAAKTSDNTTDTANSEPTGTTVGSVIAGFFKAVLWIVLIAVVLLVAFFVLAMYNEDAAALFRKYILRKPDNRRMPEEYYDERLYGDPRRRQNRNRLPQGQAQPRLRAPEDRYSQGENQLQLQFSAAQKTAKQTEWTVQPKSAPEKQCAVQRSRLQQKSEPSEKQFRP